MIFTFLSGIDLMGAVVVIAVLTALVLVVFSGSRQLLKRFFPTFSDGKTFLLSAVCVWVFFPLVFAGLFYLAAFVLGNNSEAETYVDYVDEMIQPGDSCNVALGGVRFTRALNNAASNARIDGAKLILGAKAGTDYFNSPDESAASHTAPVLLVGIDNAKPFTFTTKLTPVHDATYDAGAVYLYYDDDLWHKFAFERDERGRRRIVTVRTSFTSDDNNHDVITQSSVYLKISSNGKMIGFYYSTDNLSWNLARLHRNEYPETIWLGVSSQSPTGNGNTTTFEDCSLVHVSVADFRSGV